jgi:aspartate beta-hydroxylase
LQLRSDKGFQPYRGPEWSGGEKAKDGVGYSSHKNGNWNVFYLQLHAMEFITNVQKVPVLMGLLKKHLPKPFNHCFISALTPGTHITPHYGPNNKKLRFHLPIMGCEGASLKVNNQVINLQEGNSYSSINL